MLTHLQALGAPTEAKSYTFEAPEGTPAELAEGPIIDVMKEAAAKAGVLPAQFQAVVGAAVQALGKTAGEEDGSVQARHEKNLAAFKEQHGDMMDNQIRLANLGLEKEAGDKAKDLMNVLNDAGLGTDPLVLNFLAKVGERHTEDSAAGLKGSMPVPVATNLAEADRLQAEAVMEKDPFKQKALIDRAVSLRQAAHGETRG